MKKRFITHIIMAVLLVLAATQSCFAAQKVLLIIETYLARSIDADNVLNGFYQEMSLESKKCGTILWDAPYGGTDVQLCDSLYKRLQAEYVASRDSGDILEGATLIGNLPAPMYSAGDYYPLDQVFMDIVDANGNLYTTSPYDTANGYYTGSYNPNLGGDYHYDIWISRVNSSYLQDGIRQGSEIIPNGQVEENYLMRLSNRMTEPETVPSRGFGLSGYWDIAPYGGSAVWDNMRLLNLPWFAEFGAGANSPYNWISQLMGGPYGTINYGAFNGTLFPIERNRRFCRYTQLPICKYGSSYDTNITVTGDSLGWEWAGLGEHSGPNGSTFQYGTYQYLDSNFNYVGKTWVLTLNGTFASGTIGEFWGDLWEKTDARYYNGSAHYYNDTLADSNGAGPYYPGGDPYCFDDTIHNPNNPHWGSWKAKSAEWHWPVTATNTYNVYLSYISLPTNSHSVPIKLAITNVDSNGAPIAPAFTDSLQIHDTTVNQTMHNIDSSGNFEKVFSNIAMTAGQMAILQISANGVDSDVIADAVKFQSIDGAINIIVDDTMPITYDTVPNHPEKLYTTKGFFTSDANVRNFEDMGNEPGGGGTSKTRFFVMNCCEINDWLYQSSRPIGKNMGNLYALGHNGLICMGASTLDYSNGKGLFFDSLSKGGDFGQAYVAWQNAHFGFPWYALLGAGTLRAQPYIQFGTQTIQNQKISTTQTVNTANPVLLINDTVTSTGTYNVTSTNSSSSPVCSHSEIVIRPETWFQQGCSVDIKAQ